MSVQREGAERPAEPARSSAQTSRAARVWISCAPALRILAELGRKRDRPYHEGSTRIAGLRIAPAGGPAHRLGQPAATRSGAAASAMPATASRRAQVVLVPDLVPAHSYEPRRTATRLTAHPRFYAGIRRHAFQWEGPGPDWQSWGPLEQHPDTEFERDQGCRRRNIAPPGNNANQSNTVHKLSGFETPSTHSSDDRLFAALLSSGHARISERERRAGPAVN